MDKAVWKEEAHYIAKTKILGSGNRTSNLKILIILLYWDRPKMIRNALNSIKEQTYDNWELAFIDDGSEAPGEPIVREILKDHLNQVKIIRTETTMAERFSPGSPIGLHMNNAVMDSDADVVVILCDDDALLPNYCEQLNIYFTMWPDEVWGYCHVIAFDPSQQDYHTAPPTPGFSYNGHTGRIAPSCAVDSSQVVYRSKCTKEGGIYWIYPQTGCLDCNFYEKMVEVYGNCPFMSNIGQYKAVFPDQMGKRGLTKPADIVYGG